jgi:hypothetical protein
MILPDKYIKLPNSFVGHGAFLIGALEKDPCTISILWEKITAPNKSIGWTLDKLLLTLDFLFMLNIVAYNDGLISLKKDNV